MPWFAVDDSAHTHPKIVKAGNAAIGLWMRCGSYAAQHLTDGVIPGAIATMYGTSPQIAKLVKIGLWHGAGHTCGHCPQPADGDYVMHEYLQHGNPTRQQVLERRARAAEKKRRQRGAEQPPPQNPGPNRSRIEDETRANRDRFEDETEANREPLFPEDAGHGPASRGDSLGTRARAFPSPPLPSQEQTAEVGGGTTGSRARAEQRPDGRPAPAPIDDDGFTLTDDMRRWAHRDGYADLIDIDHATQQFVSHYRSTGAHRKSWPDAWQKWIRDDAKKAAERNTPRQGAFLVPLPGGGQTTPRPSTTDQRINAAREAGRRVQARMNARRQQESS